MIRVRRFNSKNEYLRSLNESNKKEIKKAAGVCILYKDNILLVHASDANKERNAYGIPKGGMESGENYMEAAIREVREETGISINPRVLDKNLHVANSYNRKGEVNWQLYYYIYKIEELSEVGMSNMSVNKDDIQVEEVDWVGFVPIDKAYKIINRSQLIILDRVR